MFEYVQTARHRLNSLQTFHWILTIALRWMLFILVCLGVNEGLETFMVFQVIKPVFLYLIVCYFSCVNTEGLCPCLTFWFQKYRYITLNSLENLVFLSFLTLSTYFLHNLLILLVLLSSFSNLFFMQKANHHAEFLLINTVLN